MLSPSCINSIPKSQVTLKTLDEMTYVNIYHDLYVFKGYLAKFES